jgi:hypothetical protein
VAKFFVRLGGLRIGPLPEAAHEKNCAQADPNPPYISSLCLIRATRAEAFRAIVMHDAAGEIIFAWQTNAG